MKVAEYAKAYVALVALVAQALVEVVPVGSRTEVVLRIVLAVAGAVAVWGVPNRSEPAEAGL